MRIGQGALTRGSQPWPWLLDWFTQEWSFQKTLETLLKCGSTENGACICMWLEQKRNRSIRACFQGNLSYCKRTSQKEKEKKTWFFFYPWDWNLHISAHSGNEYFTAPLAQTLNPLTHAPVVTNERWPLFRFWCHHLWLNWLYLYLRSTGGIDLLNDPPIRVIV